MSQPVDHYRDGEWYDAEYVHIRADLPLYSAIAREATGPVLELACGTGRLSLPMASAGAWVTGVDLSEAMIRRAKAKQSQLRSDVQTRLRFEVGDMRTFRAGRRFDRVVLAFNALLHMLEDDHLLAALATARAHLAPGGRCHLDVFTPEPGLPSRDPDERYDPQQMIDPRTRQRWVVTENNRYDPRQQINHMRFYYRRAGGGGEPTGPELCAEVPLRVLFPRELDAFIRTAGLRIAAEYDDYGRTRPYTATRGLRVLELELASSPT